MVKLTIESRWAGYQVEVHGVPGQRNSDGLIRSNDTRQAREPILREKTAQLMLMHEKAPCTQETSRASRQDVCG